MADPQDKKKKDWSLFGRTEDNAIARAKYKREMGINPKAQTESSAEVSRSAKSMKNPTSRPYDPADSAKVARLKKKEVAAPAAIASSASGKTFERGKGNAALPRKQSSYSGYGNDTTSKTYGYTPKKKEAATVGSVSVPTPVKNTPDKSSQAGKMTNFQRMKARQFEKEGVAGRSMTSAAAKRKAVEKTGGMDTSSLKAKIPFFGTKKADKPAGRSKSERAAAFRALMQGRAK